MDTFLTIAVLLPLAAAFLAFLFPADKPKMILGLHICRALFAESGNLTVDFDFLPRDRIHESSESQPMMED